MYHTDQLLSDRDILVLDFLSVCGLWLIGQANFWPLTRGLQWRPRAIPQMRAIGLWTGCDPVACQGAHIWMLTVEKTQILQSDCLNALDWVLSLHWQRFGMLLIEVLPSSVITHVMQSESWCSCNPGWCRWLNHGWCSYRRLWQLKTNGARQLPDQQGLRCHVKQSNITFFTIRILNSQSKSLFLLYLCY